MPVASNTSPPNESAQRPPRLFADHVVVLGQRGAQRLDDAALTADQQRSGQRRIAGPVAAQRLGLWDAELLGEEGPGPEWTSCEYRSDGAWEPQNCLSCPVAMSISNLLQSKNVSSMALGTILKPTIRRPWPPHSNNQPHGSRSSAATASRSRGPTAPTPRPPTRTCSPRRSSGLVDRFNLARRAARHGDRWRGAQAQPRLQPDARVRAGQRAVALHAGVRSAAGLRHRPAGGHRRRRRDRRRPLRGGRRGRGGHHLRRADRIRRRPAPHAARAAAVEVQRRAAQAGRQAARVAGRARSPPTASPAPGCRWASTPRSRPSRWASSASTRTSWPPPVTATWPPPTTAGSSTISSPRSSVSTATTICGPTRRRRSWPRSGRCSA